MDSVQAARVEPGHPQLTPKSWKEPVGLFLFRIFYAPILAGLLVMTAVGVSGKLGVFGFIIFYLLVFTACFTVHELGHALGAALAKLRLSIFSVGFLMLVRQGGAFRIKFNRVFLPGGFTYAAPLDELNLERRLIYYTAGGPLLGALYGLACLVWYFALPAPEYPALAIVTFPENLPLQAWLLANSGISLLISLHSLAPDTSRSVTSDGFKLIQYWRRTHESRSLKSLYLLEGASQNGVRPKHWRDDLLDFLCQPETPNGRRIQAFLLKYYVELDRGNVIEAGHNLDQALMLGRGAIYPGANLYQEAAYFTARYRNQPIVARQWLQRARPGFLDEAHSQARAEAAVLLAEGLPHEALVLVSKGLKTVDHSLELGTAIAEREWLEDLATQASQLLEKEETISLAQAVVKRLEEAQNLALSSGSADQEYPLPVAEGKDSTKRLLQFPAWEKFQEIFFLVLIPWILFWVVIFMTNSLVDPPICQPKLVENLVCKTRYQVSLAKGLFANWRGDSASALDAYTQSLDIDARGDLARRFRIRLYEESGEIDKALDDYQILLGLYPADPPIFLGRARLYLELGDYEKAIQDAISGQMITPDELSPEFATFLKQAYQDALPTNLGTVFEQDWLADSQNPVKLCKLSLFYAYAGDWAALEKLMVWQENLPEVLPGWCWQEILGQQESIQ